MSTYIADIHKEIILCFPEYYTAYIESPNESFILGQGIVKNEKYLIGIWEIGVLQNDADYKIKIRKTKNGKNNNTLVFRLLKKIDNIEINEPRISFCDSCGLIENKKTILIEAPFSVITVIPDGLITIEATQEETNTVASFCNDRVKNQDTSKCHELRKECIRIKEETETMSKELIELEKRLEMLRAERASIEKQLLEKRQTIKHEIETIETIKQGGEEAISQLLEQKKELTDHYYDTKTAFSSRQVSLLNEIQERMSGLDRDLNIIDQYLLDLIEQSESEGKKRVAEIFNYSNLEDDTGR